MSQQKTLKNIFSPGRGILAADESADTARKRLKAIGMKSTVETRRQYRDLFLGTNGIENHVSGVIFHEETLGQNLTDGPSFVKHLQKLGIEPGFKVDEGRKALTGTEEEYTTGLKELPEKLTKAKNLGCTFTKWRSAIYIGKNKPSLSAIQKNAEDLANYANQVIKAGLVPIIEPEIVRNGAHGIDKAKLITDEVLRIVFEELEKAGTDLSKTILKTSMVIPGDESGEKMDPKEVSRLTLEVLEHRAPANLGGIVFLSGGQTPEEASLNFKEITKHCQKPWPMTFSFARALQQPALEVWQGKSENLEEARKTFIKTLENNKVNPLCAIK